MWILEIKIGVEFFTRRTEDFVCSIFASDILCRFGTEGEFPEKIIQDAEIGKCVYIMYDSLAYWLK